MKRNLVLIAVLGLALTGSVVIAVAAGSPVSVGSVYTVAQVQADLAHHPSAWLGRTVRMRGIALLCLSSDSQRDPSLCSQGSTYLLDAGGANEVLPLAWAGPDPLLALARRVPLLSGLLPAPQAVHWQEIATYRVQVRAVPQSLCGTDVCFEVVLLGATP